MKKESDDNRNIVLRRSIRNKPNMQAHISVKQEETEEDRTRLKRNLRITKKVIRSEEIETDNGDSFFESDTQILEKTKSGLHCDECNFTYSSKEIYESHQRLVHKKEITNNYCNLCSRQFKFEWTYKFHMKNFHINGNLCNYCDKCKRQLGKRSSYVCHMIRLHGITIKAEPLHHNIYPDVLPDVGDAKKFCTACDHTFASRQNYNYHLKNIHQMTPKSRIPYPDKIPDMNDPNYFCAPCDRTLSPARSFRSHLVRIHQVDVCASEDEVRPKLNPVKLEINSEDRYCNVCDQTFSNLAHYQLHMIRRHDVIIPKLTKSTKVDLSIEPDIYDPDNYCRVCDRNYGIVVIEIYRRIDLDPQ